MAQEQRTEGNRVPDIQTLATRAQDLSRSVDSWNSAMIWALVFAAIAAVAVVVTTYTALTRAKQLANVEGQMVEAKDKQREIELRDRDVKIAEAGTKASDAETKAEGFRLDIAKANERAAVLELHSLKLRKELVFQGPRANLISGETRQKFVDALKPFAKQKVDVRHSAMVMMVNSHIVQVTPLGDDTLSLANALIGVLKEADWNLPSNALPSHLQGQGITVQFTRDASQQTKAAAEALISALRNVPLTVTGPIEGANNTVARVGEDVIRPAFDGDTIVIDVQIHP
jgi:hypothetical protein